MHPRLRVTLVTLDHTLALFCCRPALTGIF
jgi:hypothetical protein